MPPQAGATVRQAVVLADAPSALAPTLRELCRFGVEEVVLLGGEGGAVEAALPAVLAGLPKPLQAVCSRGTLPGARGLLAQRFLFCAGEAWLGFNLARLLADAMRDGEGVLGREVLRRPDTGRPGPARAGVALLRQGVLDAITPACSWDHGVLPRLAALGVLRGTVAELWPTCTGQRRPALFLDRDGVINVDHGWVGTVERFEFVPGALEAIRAASDAGWHVFVVTNQSGIGRGYYTEAQFLALSAWVADQARAAGGTIDDLRHCPTHPEAALPEYRRASNWRKPGPGMILDLLRRWDLDPARCLLVGDQPSDMQAAAAAGVKAHLFPGGNLHAFVEPLLAGAGRT